MCTLKKHEKFAVNITKINTWLIIYLVISVLIGGVGFSQNLIDQKLFFSIFISCMWVGAIIFFGQMFSPKFDTGGNKIPSKFKKNSNFMQIYGFVFMSIWFTVLVFITIKLLIKMYG